MFSINTGRHDGCASLVLSQDAERSLAAIFRQGCGESEIKRGVSGLIHIHAYYPDLLGELLEPIARNWPGSFPEFLITVPADGCGRRLEACRVVFAKFFPGAGPSCSWLEVENRGRNLLPLIQVLELRLAVNPCIPWVLHLHTKKTLDPDGIGDGWRRDLLQKLVGSSEQICAALRLLFDSDLDHPVGLVAPTRYAGIERQYHWGGNFQLSAELIAGLFPGRRLHPDQLLHFPAGLMFWCRPQALRSLLELPRDLACFPAEPLGTNGTVAHAVERLICHVVEAAGWQWRLLDRLDPAMAVSMVDDVAVESAADCSAAASLMSMPSVWERRGMTFQRLLSQRLRGQQQRRDRERRRQKQLVLQLHQCRRGGRSRGWLFWLPSRPLEVALLLQKAGKGYVSSAYLRLLEPLRLLEQQGRCRVRILDSPSLGALCGAEVVIAQRGALANPGAADRLRQQCCQLQIRLIADIDDALCSMPPRHKEYQRYRAQSAAVDRLLGCCDHTIFSTPVLKDVYCRHLAGAGLELGASTVIANGLSPRLWRPELQGVPVRRPLPAGVPLQLLYMGSATHDDDFQMLLPQLDALQVRYPDRFQVHVIGALASPPERSWLRLRPVPSQVRRYPQFVPWLLQRRPYHWGIAPLRDHAFNAAKSDVKVLDYAALGLGCLCSFGPAYADLIARGFALGTNNDSWLTALSALLLDSSPIEACGRRARRYLWSRRTSVKTAQQIWTVLCQVNR